MSRPSVYRDWVGEPPAKPSLAERRALAIAALLRSQKVQATSLPAKGQTFTLTALQPGATP